MKFLKNLPMATGGFSAAFAALGNLLLPYGEVVRYICGVLSAAVLFVFIAKLFFDRDNVANELKNPAVLSVFPTTTIAIILLCAYAKPFLGMVAVYIWYMAVAAHLFIMALFVKLFVIDFRLQNVLPSWFIVSAGIVAASVSSPIMNTQTLGQILFYLGLFLSIAMAVVVIYRMMKIPLPEPLRPVTAIFTAPAGLLIVGYFSAFEFKSDLLIYIMLIIAVIGYIYVCVSMFSLLKLKFYPTYVAFTFPFVISAAAFRAANAFLIESGHYFFRFVPMVTMWVAIFLVVYASVRYIVFFLPKKQ